MSSRFDLLVAKIRRAEECPVENRTEEQVRILYLKVNGETKKAKSSPVSKRKK